LLIACLEMDIYGQKWTEFHRLKEFFALSIILSRVSCPSHTKKKEVLKKSFRVFRIFFIKNFIMMATLKKKKIQFSLALLELNS
jgi:hypothetical protein